MERGKEEVARGSRRGKERVDEGIEGRRWTEKGTYEE